MCPRVVGMRVGRFVRNFCMFLCIAFPLGGVLLPGKANAAGELDSVEIAAKTNRDWMGKAVLNKRAVKIGVVVQVELLPTGRMRAIQVDTRDSGKEGLPTLLTFGREDTKLTRYHVLVELDKARNREPQETQVASVQDDSPEASRLDSAWRVATGNK